LAASNRLPVIYPFREFPEAGGLVSYGASLVLVQRRAAAFVDKILKGAKPADLPVEQPAKLELVVNVKVAKVARSHRAALAARASQRGDRISQERWRQMCRHLVSCEPLLG